VNPIYWELGEGLAVRTYTPDDAEEVFALVDVNRERLDRWFPWAEHVKTAADQRGWIEGCLASETDLEANGMWYGGRLAGSIGLSVNPVNDSGEIGYWLDEGAEGAGIVTRSCRRVLEYAFRERGLHRVQIHAAVENVRSQAVAERLGMVREGVERGGGKVAGGRYLDLIVFSMLASEWVPPAR
jgi:ribosomal-protein-serine acetyltransferase